MRHWLVVEELDGHQPLVMEHIWVESDIPQTLDVYEREGRTVHVLEVEFKWKKNRGMTFDAGWY